MQSCNRGRCRLHVRQAGLPQSMHSLPLDALPRAQVIDVEPRAPSSALRLGLCQHAGSQRQVHPAQQQQQ